MSGPRRPVPVGGTVSNVVGEALYKAEDYEGAAWIFEQLVAGGGGGDVDRGRAEFWLGKSYFRLDDFERSARVLLEIAATREHEYRSLSYAWLMSLRNERPDDVTLLRVVAEEGDALLEDEAYEYMREQIRVTMAEYALRTGRPEVALEHTRYVFELRPYYVDALLLQGLAAERLGRRREAVDRLRQAAAWGAPTRRQRRRGEYDEREERVRQRARRELERLGQPLD